jgi:hypothetical protein
MNANERVMLRGEGAHTLRVGAVAPLYCFAIRLEQESKLLFLNKLIGECRCDGQAEARPTAM